MAGYVGAGSQANLGTGSGTGGTGLSVSKTGVAAGNLLVVAFSIWRSTNTDPGVVSASGWTAGPEQVESASSRTRTGWLFLPGAGAGTIAASLSWANAADCTAQMHEYSGMPGAFLDGTAGNSSSNSPFNTGNATSGKTGGLAVAVIADDGSNSTYTISDGKNSRGGRNPSPDLPALLVSDLLSTVSLTNSGAWTSSPTNVPGDAVYAIGVLFAQNVFDTGPTARPRLWVIQRPDLRWRFGARGSDEQIAGTVAASDADAGTGSDAATQIGLQASDSGAGGDAAANLSLTVSDSGAGADTVGSIGLSSAETATGGDAVAGVGLGGSETGSGADAVAGIALTAAESGTGGEAPSLIALSVGDTATVADNASAVDLGSTPKSGADTASGSEAVTGLTLSAAETATGADQVGGLGLTGSESAAAAESASIALAAADSGVAADAASVVILGGGTLLRYQLENREAPTALDAVQPRSAADSIEPPTSQSTIVRGR